MARAATPPPNSANWSPNPAMESDGWRTRRKARAASPSAANRQAALKASHMALMLLVVMILVLAAALSIPALVGWRLIGMSSDAPVIAANVLLAMVVIAELSRAGLTLALLPRR